MRRVRLGIDVGGTFTDVVAVDAHTGELLAKVKTPTTHNAPGGVAAGIIAGIHELLAREGITPDDVAFIAHSTTQATNALLEGDLARVAVIGLGTGLTGALAQTQIRFAPLALGAGATFAPAFVAAKARAPRDVIDAAVGAGAQAIAVSGAFAVDDPAREVAFVAAARAIDILATSGHEVSTMYGLRARTRTAALNAAILPKMVQTARMTSAAVDEAKIGAPLMIMRSDGGVMDVREVERRPILTLLSGPAAGVAGALLHENVTDGIFIEVGGTSADCSAIRGGSPQMRPARIGGYRTMLRTVDVRTIAIAGGSLVRMNGERVVDVGPRSAHIADCEYASFAPLETVIGARVETLAPMPGDPSDYVILRARDGARIAITPTCAANMLGVIPSGAFASGDAAAATAAFEMIAQARDTTAHALATAVLDVATQKLRGTIDELIGDYDLDPELLEIVGGGGGCAALIPYAAKKLGYTHRLARDAEVISPLGVALALVRDVVERTIVDPSADDILRVRREAAEAAIASGAAPDLVEVAIEIDAQRNLVRAIASGATALGTSTARGVLGDAARREAAARVLGVPPADVREVGETMALRAFSAQRILGPRFARKRTTVAAIVDDRGVVRMTARDALVRAAPASELIVRVAEWLEEATEFGDVGRALPAVALAYRARIAEFRGLADAATVARLIEEEIAGLAPEEPTIVLLIRTQA